MLKAWCASVMYVNVKGVNLGAFRYIFGIHMLHNIFLQVQNSLWHLISAVLLYSFLHIFFFFLLYYIEFQCVNKDKVPTNKQNLKKQTKKNKLWCIICSQPISLIFGTILGWLPFFFFSPPPLEVDILCIPNLWVEIYCVMCATFFLVKVQT